MMDRVQEGEGILGWTEIILRSLPRCRSGGGFVLHRESNLSLLGGASLSHIWHSRTETTQLEAFQSSTFWPESSWETDCAASSDIRDRSSTPGSRSDWRILPPGQRWEVVHTVWAERNPSCWQTNLKSNKDLAWEETRTQSAASVSPSKEDWLEQTLLQNKPNILALGTPPPPLSVGQKRSPTTQLKSGSHCLRIIFHPAWIQQLSLFSIDLILFLSLRNS